MERRSGWRRWFTRRGRSAWRMDQAPVPQVAWAYVPELTPRAAPADVVPAPSPWPAEERLDQAMPSVYCARCGQASPEGARFCSHCGAPLTRAGAERPGESTSTTNVGLVSVSDAASVNWGAPQRTVTSGYVINRFKLSQTRASELNTA